MQPPEKRKNSPQFKDHPPKQMLKDWQSKRSIMPETVLHARGATTGEDREDLPRSASMVCWYCYAAMIRNACLICRKKHSRRERHSLSRIIANHVANVFTVHADFVSYQKPLITDGFSCSTLEIGQAAALGGQTWPNLLSTLPPCNTCSDSLVTLF